MKLLMILGGLIGFVMGVLLGLAQGSAWSGVLWRASVAALLAGLLFRWWGKVWIHSLVEAHREREEAAIKAESLPTTGPAQV